MHYRRLGRTDLNVSVIGFGASPLGNVYSKVTSAAAMEAVRAAVDQGINLFDVSPYYGSRLAEERLGEAIAPMRSQVLLATKCGRYGADTFDFSADTIVREFDQSLRRLRTDYVDILQAHDVEFGEVDQMLNETIPALERLKQQGKVRSIGVTGYWPGLLARIASMSSLDCVLNYCHANLFVDDVELELAAFARRSRIGLLNASPLHMGLLGNTPLSSWHPAPQPVREAAREVRAACERFGVDAGTLSLRVCLDHDIFASTLVGLSNKAEVSAACEALDWTPPEELMVTVRALVQPVHNVVWPSGLDKNADTLADNMAHTSAASHVGTVADTKELSDAAH